MIIWNGWGLLALFIPAVGIFLGMSISDALYGTNQHPTVIAGMLFLSAVAVWLLGKKVNSAPERVLVDAQTGEEVRLKNKHSLFWIPMQWFVVACIASGIFVQPDGRGYQLSCLFDTFYKVDQ